MRLRHANRRRAAYVVEAAIVISMVILFLFGIFEYGRYIFVMQVVENATREGARMAIAHTNDKTTADVQARVTEKLARVTNQISGLTITVEGLILQPQNTGEVAGQPLTDWTDAAYTDGVSVTVSGTYQPILPSLVKMPASIPINVRSVMYSEGN